ncbi:MAG: Na+/H+ antiporter subunit E [Phycisphaerae bacterium]|nr:Na+/H+ antiporter subunit E [Phycisphaerae bacterium]
MLAANIIIAVVWTLVLGPFTPGNLLVGFILGFVLIWLAGGEVARRSGYVRRTRAAIALIIFTLVELVKANVRVAYYTISSISKRTPAVLTVPIEPDLTDTEITLLSNLITMTPGTLTMDVADDRSCIFVHFMHVDDAESEIEAIKTGFERKILEVTR